jgi:predicted phage terminase large subunit-like protein
MSGQPPEVVDVVAERLRRARQPPVIQEEPDHQYSQAYSLIGFTQYLKAKYRPSRVHHYIAESLERVERGEIDRLIIEVPPRIGKTELASKTFPAFCLGRRPDRQFLAASASANLAYDIGRSVRNIIKSDTYQLIFPNVSLEADSKAAGKWHTAEGGEWYSVGVGGDVLGRGANIWLIDDSFGSMADAQSAVMRDRVWDWFNGTVYNRLEPGGAIVIIGSRLHEDDLAGRLTARMRAGGDDVDQWTIIRLPALAEEVDPLGRQVGEPIWPERFPLRALERIRANTFARDWSALYQQNPVPEEGEFFQPDNMPTKDVSDIVDRVRAWDLASSRGGDFTVGVRIGRTRDNRFIIEHVARFRGLPNEVEDKVLATARADGPAVKVSLPKDPGQAGAHQVLSLTRLLAGFNIAASPETGDKVTRAKPFAAQVNVGNVALAGGGWVDAYREELRAFPHSKYDDQVDASSRAFMELTAAPGPMVISPVVMARLRRNRTMAQRFEQAGIDRNEYRSQYQWGGRGRVFFQ